MFKRKVMCVLFLVFLLLFISCGRSEEATVENEPDEVISNNLNQNSSEEKLQDENKKTDKPEPTQKPEVQKDYYSDFVFPIEGLRPYAAMIDNEGTRCLPQGGISKAQLVYEILVEGGTTRLMPVFWEQKPEMIGPVRSSRHYFLDYVLEHDAIYIHFGWSPMAMRDIPKFGINNLNGVANGGEVFWDITPDPGNWQDSYTSMEKVEKYVDRVKYRRQTKNKLVFDYNDKNITINSDSKAEKVSLKYSYFYDCGFTYDSENKIYMRFRDGKPHIERLNGNQLTTRNIIIQITKNYTIKGDKKGRQEVLTVGSGNGWYITNGKAVKIRWSKRSRTSPTSYVDRQGNNIKLNPGPTWIEIFPASGKISFE